MLPIIDNDMLSDNGYTPIIITMVPRITEDALSDNSEMLIIALVPLVIQDVASDRDGYAQWLLGYPLSNGHQ